MNDCLSRELTRETHGRKVFAGSFLAGGHGSNATSKLPFNLRSGLSQRSRAIDARLFFFYFSSRFSYAKRQESATGNSAWDFFSAPELRILLYADI